MHDRQREDPGPAAGAPVPRPGYWTHEAAWTHEQKNLTFFCFWVLSS